MTSVLSKNIWGNLLLVARIATVNRTPNKVDMNIVTSMENLACLGRLAPSSSLHIVENIESKLLGIALIVGVNILLVCCIKT